MNLPLLFDIALGSIFIFLILSLLASEIQELIATVLQWRAEHLKKSIENLLLGNTSENSAHQSFVDALYRSPLIKALNQESKGVFPRFFRGTTRGLGSAYRTLTRTRDVFAGQGSGPSYIDSKTFADALLERLNLEVIGQRVSQLTLQQFSEERLDLLQNILNSLRNSIGDNLLLDNEFKILQQQLQGIRADFDNNRIDLSDAIDQAIAQVSHFIDNTEALLKDDNFCKDIIRSRLPFLKQSILLKKLEPTVYEVLAMILEGDRPLSPEMADIVMEIRGRVADIPPELRKNILALAKQSQLKAQGLKAGILQLDQDVQYWFDRSMERASGVYRRNAKGVAIILGVLIATATNSDTFLIVDRLSRDTAVRATVSQSANQLLSQQAIRPLPAVSRSPELDGLSLPNDSAALESELASLRDAVGNVLGDIPLPIGWNSENLSRQFPVGTNLMTAVPKTLLGWLITGIAISMGSNFWFGLLSKVVRVRNTGATGKSNPSD
ncbi:hypothetical protein ACQ4M4_21655 [Leptolyngbya sp. AN02str]|uniref:hypothetical protein n=1 Tax=Leptolyngbya sp. AN02str TaxID=3423363 RepID=UPI003D30F05E